jgi:hypothetical protein
MPPSNLSDYEIVKNEVVNPGTTGGANFIQIEVNAPSGKKVIGGGAYESALITRLSTSAPKDDGSGWRATFHGPSNTSFDSGTWTVYAICAKTS